MNTKHSVLTISLVLFFLLGSSGIWAQDKCVDLLEGKWMNLEDTTKFEQWVKQDSIWLGKAFQISSTGIKKTWETLSVYKRAGVYTYEATVEHNAKAIAFALTKSSDTELIFSNKKHDFPNHIRYLFINKDRLKVEVYSDDKSQMITFNFARV